MNLRRNALLLILSLVCGEVALSAGSDETEEARREAHVLDDKLKQVVLQASEFQQSGTYLSSPPITATPIIVENILDSDDFHTSYHPLSEVEAFIADLSFSYPSIVSAEVVGQSAEGRDIFALRIANDTEPDGDTTVKVKGGNRESKERKEKGILVVTGAQHAREWIATASALYLAHALVSPLTSPPSHAKLSALLSEYDVHVVPVPNPDGYVYTWEEDRMWFKNRQDVSGDEDDGEDEVCLGLDMNRNWGFAWSPSDGHPLSSNYTPPKLDYPTASPSTSHPGTEKPKKPKKGKKSKKDKKKDKKKSPTPETPRPQPEADPCSHWYPGRRPFEAPETSALASYVQRIHDPLRNGGKMRGVELFLDLRSYGQMMSFPYSYSCDAMPPDAENLYEAALGAAFTVRKTHGTVYTTGSLCSTLYPAPGNIIDWMYAVAGVKYAYALHLGDTGTYGYALPSTWIRPVGAETVTAVSYIAEFVAKLRK